MEKFSVFVLHRIIRDADGCEDMPVKIYSTPEKAEKAAEEWFEFVKDYLTKKNIRVSNLNEKVAYIGATAICARRLFFEKK